MPGFGRAISDTCDGENENCEGGWVSKMRPFMSVMKNQLFSDHFFFQAVVFVYF